ncbi:hypothetical protein N7493_008433 [Penicillium malachiteum]|uniref:Uncharacterized protein n=1 Tax=Penicillium malachiteum TaxID=1324776 RepID=A0AAD6HHN2_9EURO|nr:hypothetical protein N7493_008433 [Penicillium malachiteum]
MHLRMPLKQIIVDAGRVTMSVSRNATENIEVNTVEIGATRTTVGVIELIKPQAQFSTTCRPVIKSWPMSGGFKFEVQNT